MPRKTPSNTARARLLRKTETNSERLLWSTLRGKQLCNLKFRREHPIGPFFADFACVARMVVVEIDGGYHDATGQADLDREAYLRQLGWDVIRFTAEEVEQDPEAVAHQIAKHLGLRYEFRKRKRTGSGSEHVDAPSKRRSRNPPRP